MDENRVEEYLEKLCKQALIQMEAKQYAAELKQEGITRIMKIGVSFYKKRVKVALEE